MTDERIAHARLRAAHLFPYFSAGLFSLIPVENSDTSHTYGMETMGVDKRWRMTYHPNIFNKWTIAELAVLMVHEVMHLLRDHCGRAQIATTPEMFVWNLAADMEINDDLKDSGLPKGAVFPNEKPFDFPEGLMAEEYYRLLQKSGKVQFQPGKNDVGSGFCGGCADGSGPSDEDGTGNDVVDGDGNPVKGISDKETQVIRNQVANEVMAAKARGNVPAGIARWAEEQLKSKVPWRTLLTNKVRGMIGEVSGMVNYSYNRPSRRQSVFGKIVMPCLRAPLPQIAMLIDTSGSMSEHELGLAVAEVDGVLRSMGCPVTVISNDAEVGAVKKVRKKGEISLVGGGGTNLGPGIEKSMELKPKINFLIIVSDCDADWGTARPKFPVICVKVGNSRSKPPEWMKTIEVDCE